MEDNKDSSYALPTEVLNLIEKVGFDAIVDMMRAGLDADTAMQIVAKGYKVVKIQEPTHYYPSRNARFIGPHALSRRR